MGRVYEALKRAAVQPNGDSKNNENLRTQSAAVVAPVVITAGRT